jgi:hypothetical protein
VLRKPGDLVDKEVCILEVDEEPKIENCGDTEEEALVSRCYRAREPSDEHIVAQTGGEKDTDEIRSAPRIESEACECRVVVSPVLRYDEVTQKKQRQEVEQEESRAKHHTEGGENSLLTLPVEWQVVN